MKVRVIVLNSYAVIGLLIGKGNVNASGDCHRDDVIDHDDPSQRRVLGEQCRNAFEAGQCVLTYPVSS